MSDPRNTEAANMSEDKARKEVSRRDFLKGAVMGAGAAALAGLGPAEIDSLPLTQVPRKWDYDADIVVLGTGLAGLSTAITAYDEGAKVLILEKMPQRFEGGTSKVSGNLWWAPTNLPDGIAHIRDFARAFITGHNLIDHRRGEIAVDGLQPGFAFL